MRRICVYLIVNKRVVVLRGAEEFSLAVENWLAFLFGLIHISLLQHRGRVGAFECVQMFTILVVNKSCFSIFLV